MSRKNGHLFSEKDLRQFKKLGAHVGSMNVF